MKKIILALLLMATSASAATVTFQWDGITDTSVTKVNIYQSTSSTAAKPWTKISTVNIPATTVSITASSGTYYWYATAATATAESVPSTVVTATVPLGAPNNFQVTVTP